MPVESRSIKAVKTGKRKKNKSHAGKTAAVQEAVCLFEIVEY